MKPCKPNEIEEPAPVLCALCGYGKATVAGFTSLFEGDTPECCVDGSMTAEEYTAAFLPPPLAGEADPEYQTRIEAARLTWQFRDAIRPTKRVDSWQDLPLFGGPRQQEIF